MQHKLTSKAVVSTKGQVVIPKAIREKLSIRSGNELLFEITANNEIYIKPLKSNIDSLFGCCKTSDNTMSIADIDAAIAEAVMQNNVDHEC